MPLCSGPRMTKEQALDAAIRWIQVREKDKYSIANGRAVSDYALDRTKCCEVVYKALTLDSPEVWSVFMEVPTNDGRVNAFVEFDMCGRHFYDGIDVERNAKMGGEGGSTPTLSSPGPNVR